VSWRGRVKILVVGVGGQGALTAARWLGDAALRAGEEVAVGQLHGMAQRGGSVLATVLVGPGLSSYIRDGGADVALALEPLEALRARPSLSARTRVVVNSGRVVPHTLAQGGGSYPELDAILDGVRAVAPDVTTVDGPRLVAAAGAPRALSAVMLGALAGLGLLPFDPVHLRLAVGRGSPPALAQANVAAFDLGAAEVAKPSPEGIGMANGGGR
jgi:indolepyruvate ferredoxin oxidoreductase beta subunit